MRLPAGDAGASLGAGRAGYGFSVIVSRAAEVWEVHAQLGYLRNRNDLGERRDLGQASLAAVGQLAPRTRLGLDIGVSTNPGGPDGRAPAFAIAGVMHAVTATSTPISGIAKE